MKRKGMKRDTLHKSLKLSLKFHQKLSEYFHNIFKSLFMEGSTFKLIKNNKSIALALFWDQKQIKIFIRFPNAFCNIYSPICDYFSFFYAPQNNGHLSVN